MKKLLLFISLAFAFGLFTNAQDISKNSINLSPKIFKSLDFNKNVTAPRASGCDTTIPACYATCTAGFGAYPFDRATPIDSGYFTGQNYLKVISEVAQRYTGVANTVIPDVIIWFSLKVGSTGNTQVKIYSVGANGKPNALLGISATTIAKSAIDTSNGGFNYKNIYHFTTPISSSSNFFVSVVIPTTFTAGTDELAIPEADVSCSADNGDSTSCFKVGSAWYTYRWYLQKADNFDLAIFPVICATTGIDNIINDNNISMYPNPAFNQFTIDFSGYKRTDAIVEVYNMVGKLVKSISSNGLTDKMVIDISNESAGIYFVNIKTPEGSIMKKLSLVK